MKSKQLHNFLGVNILDMGMRMAFNKKKNKTKNKKKNRESCQKAQNILEKKENV